MIKAKNRFTISVTSLAVAMVLGSFSSGILAATCTGVTYTTSFSGSSALNDGDCILIDGSQPNARAINTSQGNVTANGTVTISVAGGGSYGISATGHNVSIQNADVFTKGPTSFGVFAGMSSSSSINVTGVLNVETTNRYSYGIWSSNGSRITLGTATNVITSGDNSYGIYASNNGLINSAGTIYTNTSSGSGVSTYGVYANTGTINLSGGSLYSTEPTNVIITGGDNSDGLRSEGGGVINITGASSRNDGVFTTTIDTSFSGNDTVGIHTVGTSSKINLSGNTKVITGGDNSYGLFAEAGSSISNAGLTRILNDRNTDTNDIGVYASGSGASIDLADIYVQTRGQWSSGIRADNAGLVIINGNSIIDTAGGAANTIGVHATGADSTVNLSNVSILTSGDGSYGISADNGGLVNAIGTVSVDTSSGSGVSTYGVYANTGTITLSGGNSSSTAPTNVIITGGNTSDGLRSEGGGVINITGVSSRIAGVFTTIIDTSVSGNDTVGIHTVGTGSKINLSGNTNVITGGNNSYGLFAEAGSSIINKGSTSINSNSSVDVKNIGIYASGADASISLADINVSTRGEGSSGIRADKGGLVTINGNSTINTAGSAANTIGVHATDSGSIVTLKGGGTIDTDGDGSHGLAVDNAGKIIVNGTLKIITRGNNSAGVMVDDTATGFARIHLDSASTGNSITTYGTNSPGIAFINDTTSISLVELNSIDISTFGFGSDALYIDPDQLLINNLIKNSNYFAQQGNGINLIGGSRNITTDSSNITSVYGLGISAQNQTLLVLNLTNNSTLTGAIVQDSTSTVGLTVDSTSTWSSNQNSMLQTLNNDGVINLTSVGTTTTVLGDYTSNGGLLNINSQLDGDSSPTARLIVKGSTSGIGRVAVNNVNGSGAKTVNGIEVISVAGSSNAQFTLQGRAVVGVYEYGLFQGTPTVNDGNWYLRSLEVLRPEDGAYLANQNIVNSMFVQSLHDRRGETMDDSDLYGSKEINNNIWVRISGGNQKSQAADGQLNNRTQTNFVQVGGDFIKLKKDKNSFHVGVMFSAGRANTNSIAQDNEARAKGDVNGYALGIYGTWSEAVNARNEGPYIDSWLQYGSYKNSVKGDFLGNQNYNSHNCLISVEGGYAIALTQKAQNNWYIQPQAQLIYSNYKQDVVNESYSTRISSLDSNGWVGRVGASVYTNYELTDGMKLKPFAALNMLHNHNSAAEQINNVIINSDEPNTRVEAKLGLEAKLSRSWNIWGQAACQTGSHSYQQIGGNLGVKYIW